MAARTTNQNCPVCDELTTITCATCRQVSYCSIECQEAVATAHDNICPLWEHFDATPPLAFLGKKYCRVLWFPDDDNLPVFTWREVVGDPVVGKRPEFVTILRTNDVETSHPELDINPLTGKKLRHRIIVVNDRAWKAKDLPVTWSINAASAGQDRQDYHRTWCGNVVAYCGKFDESGVCTEIKDMDLVDFSHVVAYLNAPAQAELWRANGYGGKIDAVRVASEAGVAGGQEVFKAVKLPLTHPALKRGQQSVAPMSVLAGKQLHFATIPNSENKSTVNEVILDMLTIVDVEDDRYGTVSEEWEDTVGDVFIFLHDRSRIDVDTVKEYLRYSEELRGRLWPQSS